MLSGANLLHCIYFCFVLLLITFMPLTHPRRSRNPLINMYVTFILKMAIHAFQSKTTLLTTWSKQRVCFSQLTNCHKCFVIKLLSQLIGSDENVLKHLGGVTSNSFTQILELNNTDSIDEFPPQIIPTSVSCLCRFCRARRPVPFW